MHGHSHAHHHGHHHGHSHGGIADRGRERRALKITLALAGTVLIAEVIGGILSQSLALLSDGAHMFSDFVAQGLSLAALVLASRPADARRTYGWHRLEIVAALFNGMMLVALALALLWGAIHRLGNPVDVKAPLMLGVAAVGFVANLASVFVLHGSASLNARGAYLHVLLDTFSSVTVIVGGIVLWIAPQNRWLDPALSIAIALFIFYSAYLLVRDAVDVLLETVPRDIDLSGVSRAMDRIEGVAAVHDLHIWTITSGLYALSAHIVVGESATSHDALIARINDMLLHDFHISHTTLQIETTKFEHVGRIC